MKNNIETLTEKVINTLIKKQVSDILIRKRAILEERLNFYDRGATFFYNLQQDEEQSTESKEYCIEAHSREIRKREIVRKNLIKINAAILEINAYKAGVELESCIDEVLTLEDDLIIS